MKGHPSKILMIRPVKFDYNEQTANSNSFQQKEKEDPKKIQEEAQKEFETFIKKLQAAGIEVIEFFDTSEPHTPDSVFPNNWISFHSNHIILYPMMAENRRKERRQDIVDYFSDQTTSILDISKEEVNGFYLEGTGSIVFDYENRIAYASLSPRTNEQLLTELCNWLNYKEIPFRAVDQDGVPIYHTNVLMSIGKGFAVLCKECITDKEDLETVMNQLKENKHTIIEITIDQMNAFAGNMYQLFNKDGKSFIIMSEQAYLSLDPAQIEALEKFGSIIQTPLYTIEKYGGGSARCMIAEIR